MKQLLPFLIVSLAFLGSREGWAQFTVNGPETICYGTPATLTATNCTGTLKWSTGATTASITVSPVITTTYYATCTVGTTTTTGSLSPVVLPGLQLNSSAGTCFTGQTTLSASGLPAGGSFWWEKDGSPISNTLNSYDATQPGTYTVRADVSATPVWTWQNLLPDGDSFNDVYFADDFVGVAVGDFGKIVRTTDSGETWTRVPSFEQFDYVSVHFVNSTTGWLIGREGQLLKTTDAGLSWFQMSFGGSYYNLTEIFFTDPDHGWITDANSNSVLRTTNGGQSWQASANGPIGLRGVFFTDNNTGWAAGFSLKKTTDGGVTWNTINFGGNNALYDVFFVDASRGWLVGLNNTIYKTTDGGNSWTYLGNTFPPGTNFKGVFFTDENNGVLLAWKGIYKTTNGGNSWNLTEAPAIDAQAVYMRNPSRAWVAGLLGRLLTGYATPSSYGWKITRGEGIGLDGEYSNVYPGIDFVNSDIGWTINGRSFLLKTTNGGKVWTNTALKEVYDVDFVDANTGYAAAKGSTGSGIPLYKSTDGGNSWNPIYTLPGLDVAKIQFVSPSVGWAIVDYGINPNVYRTTNGGSTWTASNVGFNTSGFFFLDASVGWVSGADGKVAKTTDGGQSWTPVNAGTESAYYTIGKICFKDNSVGWLTGSNTRKTTDGGLTWSANVINGIAVAFSSVSFADANHGIALSPYKHPGGGYYYYRTSDGGATWLRDRLPSASYFLDILLTDAANGWVINAKGAIMHYAAPTASCSASLTLQQSPPAPVVTASTQNALCEGESITLTASGCPDALSWSDGSTGATIIATPYSSTTYTAFCGTDLGCRGVANLGVAVIPKIRLDTASTAPCNRPVFTASNFWPGMDLRWQQDGNLIAAQASGDFQTIGRLNATGAGTYTAVPDAAGAWAPQTGALAQGTLTDVDFPNPETGFAVGTLGAILKSADGGTSWRTLPSGTFLDLNRIEMITPLVGWAFGFNITLKTTDGGNSWVKQKLTGISSFGGMSFFNEQIGWAFNGIKIYHTSDGGLNWTAQNTGGTAGYSAVLAVSATTAFALAYDKVWKTTDAGQTWTSQDPAGIRFLNNLYFSDENHGWVVGSTSAMAYTSDGGVTWVRRNPPQVGNGNISQVQFVDTTHGWIKVDNDYILTTVDGGQNWSVMPILSSAGLSGVGRFCLNSTSEGVVVGDKGLIARTTDGAATWRKATGTLSGFSYNDIRDIQFVDQENGFIVGSNGVFLTTANGGKNWSVRKLDFDGYYYPYSIFFVNATHGWIVGNNGIVLRTTDGGVHWSKGQISNILSGNLRIFFVDNNLGWVVGDYTRIFKTTDGGITWTQQTAPISANLQSVFFIDSNRGWIVGSNGTILTTDNSGASWTTQNSGTSNNLFSVHFTSPTEGWVAGGPDLLRTTDGGSTWQAVSQIVGSLSGNYYSKVQFVSDNTGFVLGSQCVYITQDKGASWRKSYHYGNLIAMHFTDATHGWLIGYYGILSYRPAPAPCPSVPVVVTPQSLAPLSTLASGNWNTPGVWSCGQVPTALDAVRINDGHTIALPEGYSAEAKSVELRGQIQYDANAGLQMGKE